MKLIILSLCLFLLSGCATFRGTVTDLIEEDKLNAQTSREVAQEILETWPLNYGVLYGIANDFQGSLPCQCIDDMDELLKISNLCSLKPDGTLDCSQISDLNRGRAIYLWGKTWIAISTSIAGDLIKRIVPQVFEQFAGWAALVGL